MKLPILLYHALFDKELNREKYAISKVEFERQIKYLSDSGFQNLLVDDFCKSNDASKDDKKGIVITFDDGNLSDYSIAFQILKKYGFVATFFVTINLVGSENHVDWSHLRKMAESGMSIQSHSLTHSFLSDLHTDNLYKELNESKNVLEGKLNKSVNFLSLPGGFCSRKVLRSTEYSGYKGVCTSEPGINVLDCQKMDFMVLNRFVMTRKTSFQKFRAIVNRNQRYIASCKAQYYFKAILKKLLGSKRYYEIWSKLFREV